jgi:YidC/Oxa1 family membrane protein insertase
MPILIKPPGYNLNFFDQFINLFANILTFFHRGGFGYHWLIDWGWAIIIFTVIIKIVLFPTMIKQVQVMNKMKNIQPKIKEIQDKFKDRPDELQKRTMELYQKEKVNPFGGCLPMLIQLPLLWAIFGLLQDPTFIKNSIGNATFLWFHLVQKHDLALAVISAATTFLQQKLTTPATGTDANQQVFLYIMPVMFGFFTFQVNAGVGLYWVISNIVGIAQQYIINEYFIVKEHIHKTGDNPEPETK